MKLLKILTAFLALVSLQIAAAQWLHVPPPVEARMTAPFAGGGVPVVAAGCDTAQDAETDSSGSDWFANAEASKWVATRFTLGSTEDDQSVGDSNYSVCKVVARMSTSAINATQNVTACIYDDNSGAPGSQLGTCSDAVAMNTVGQVEQDVTFANMNSGTLTNGTAYYLVFKSDAVGVPYILIYKESSATDEDIEWDGDNGASWTDVSDVYSYVFTLYSN